MASLVAARGSSLRAAARQVNWGVLDQVLSSGTNFLIAFVLVRRVSAREFGLFSFTVIVYILATGAARALNIDPLVIRHAGSLPRLRSQTPRALGFALLLGASVGIGVAAVAAATPSMRGLLLVLAVTLPLLLVQDAGRAICFAMRRPALGTANDAWWAVIQVAALGLVAVVIPDAPMWLLAATWLGAGAVAGVLVVRQLEVRAEVWHSLSSARSRMDLGIPLVGVFLLSVAPPYLLFALAPLVTGLTDLGTARAAFLPFGVFGVALQGCLLVLLPAASRRDDRGRFQLAIQASVAMAVGAILWTTLVLATPSRMGHLLLGASWAHAAGARRVFGISIIAQAVATGPLVALRAMSLPQRLVRVRTATLPAVLGGGIALTWLLGATGLALGMTVGDVLAAALAWQQLRGAAADPSHRKDRSCLGS